MSPAGASPESRLAVPPRGAAGVLAVAPTRVDLAGGTVDLYPLSAFLGGTTTVNVAIEVRSCAEARRRSDGRFVLRSEDLGARIEFASPRALEEHEGGSPLDLVVEAIRALGPPEGGLSVRTRNEAPRGSGLGASSSLLIALLGALETLSSGQPREAHRLVELAASIEAKHLQVPTGRQDYYAALAGGILAIRFGLAGVSLQRLAPPSSFLGWLERSLLLFFTGEPHFSAAPNWAILKRYVDAEPATRARLRSIARRSPAMAEAILAGDRVRFARLLAEEWEDRKGLAAEVTTPAIERLVEAAREAGAFAAKACGAGGGGTVAILAPEERASAVARAASQAGGIGIEFRIAREGLRIEPSGAESEFPSAANGSRLT